MNIALIRIISISCCFNRARVDCKDTYSASFFIHVAQLVYAKFTGCSDHVCLSISRLTEVVLFCYINWLFIKVFFCVFFLIMPTITSFAFGFQSVSSCHKPMYNHLKLQEFFKGDLLPPSYPHCGRGVERVLRALPPEPPAVFFV